ncbi:MAG: DinB family protein [Bacteroidetes bacterium]|nr:DinB family protein [Bacteroidota bacterium]
MTKSILIEAFCEKHKEFSAYINSLSDADFVFAAKDKWSAGQQLEHVYLCVVPLTKALASKEYIEQKFGKINRPIWSYEEIVIRYTNALKNGGKAPERFVPSTVALGKKAELTDALNETLKTISHHWETFSEEDLDTLVLPHPLLGNMTIREFFYLMADHATHHMNQTKKNINTPS